MGKRPRLPAAGTRDCLLHCHGASDSWYNPSVTSQRRRVPFAGRIADTALRGEQGMKRQSFGNRLATIIDAVKKASSGDSSITMPRTGKGDSLDLLADAIEELLHHVREPVTAFQSAQQAMTKLPITEEKKPEVEISRERNLLLDALDQNAPDAIYVKDRQGRFIHAPKALARAFNLKDPTEAIGKTDFDFFTEKHAREAFEDEQRIIRTGEPIVNKEEKETRPDGSETWVLTTKMPLRDEKGAIIGTIGISRDINERKRAEEALRKSEERYRLLFNSIDDAAIVSALTSDGLPGEIIEVNDIACEQLGYTRDELLRKGSLDFLAPESVAIAREMMVRSKEERHAVWEGIHVSRAGGRIPVEVSVHLFDMSGEPAILATIRDITARKQLEERLEREKTLLLTLIDNLPDHVSVKD